MKTNRDESASLWDEVLALRRVNAELVGALRTYGIHASNCGTRRGTGSWDECGRSKIVYGQCNCGYGAALAKAAGTEAPSAAKAAGTEP